MKLSLQRCRVILLVLVALCSCLASCSHNRLAAPGPGSAPSPTESARGLAGPAFPVRMRPQQPVDPGFKAASLAAPGGLGGILGSLPAPRDVSSTPDYLSLDAGEFETLAPHGRVSKIGGFAEYLPQAANLAAAELGDLAYSLYEFSSADYPADSTIALTWNETYTPESGMLFLGLSNWFDNRWDWFAADEDGVTTFPGFDNYVNDQERLVLVVAVGGVERCLLQLVNLGQPELRGTGSDGFNPGEGDLYPPLYAPPLPSSCDLSDGCSEVNDQGTWGSCTAFAFGDGAYNYLLNQIYGPLGWDLGDPFNRVSPKYLFVTSGEQWGYPPDPGYGRYMHDVGNTMLDYGLATEQNVPYDLVFDSDWSAAALDDAALLDISSWFWLPSSSSAELASVKSWLAHSEMPVVMSVLLDWDFLYYQAGDVWDYKGPPVGGHAMCIVGYDDARKAFKVRNSWSADWGDAGHCWISYSTFTRPGTQAACYAITDEYSAAAAQRFTGQTSPVEPPSGLAATDGTLDNGIALTWQPVTGATGYQVYRDTRSNLVATLGAVDNWLDESAGGSNSYMYWIRALQGVQESYYSAPDLGYVAQPPVITQITPSGGSSGQQVQFAATVYGGGPLSYAWDFGGCASPDASSETAPLVSLQSEGSYTVELTVSNAKGQTIASHDFKIGPNLSPGAYYSVTPAEGVVPLSVEFDASSSNDPDGSIVLYRWSFNNDMIWEEETTLPYTSHVFDTPGTYDTNLQVVDNSGNVGGRSRRVTVNPENWLPNVYPSIEPPYGSSPLNVTIYPNASDQDGEIVLLEYDFEDDGVYDLTKTDTSPVNHTYSGSAQYTLRVRVTDDDDALGEGTDTVIVGLGESPPGWAAYSLGNFGSDFDAYSGHVAGRPALLVGTGFPVSYKFVLADNTDPQEGEWSSEDLTLGTTLGDSISLNEIGGEAIIAVQSNPAQQLLYARRSGGSWSSHVVDTGVGHQAGSFCQIGVIDGVPCIVYTKDLGSGVTRLYYAVADSDSPADGGDWTIMQIPTTENPGRPLGLTGVGSQPVFLFQRREGGQLQLGFAYASAAPDGSEDWANYSIIGDWDPLSGHMPRELINGRPAVFYTNNSQPQHSNLYRATVAVPVQADQWASQSIDIDGGSNYQFAVLGSTPACLYNTNALRLAEASVSDPQSFIDWNRSTLWPNWKYDLTAGPFKLDSDRLATTIVYADTPSILYYAYQLP